MLECARGVCSRVARNAEATQTAFDCNVAQMSHEIAQRRGQTVAAPLQCLRIQRANIRHARAPFCNARTRNAQTAQR
eukprot:2850453-Lingulodinium_polyedra.AAC.1